MSDTTPARVADTSAWDGPAAMSACASSDDPAACYRAICAGRKEGEPDVQSSWALPHHKTPGSAPNAAGVRNSLSRLPQTQGLTNREAAGAHLRSHLVNDINEGEAAGALGGIIRGIGPKLKPLELRALDSGMPVLAGHLAVFNQWTRIESFFEGTFLERIAPGAFKKTMREQREQVRMLFQHGQDPQIADKPLAPIEELGEDDEGAFYAGTLLDTSYNRDLLPGLRAGLYGSSFRFQVIKEDFQEKPDTSSYNPDGLPERTIREVQLFEFGPVTFPAYQGASAGIRSLTDRFLRLPALPDPGAEVIHSDEGSRDVHVTPDHKPLTVAPRFRSRDEWLDYLSRS